jgi:predicted alpha/beta-fold hydrolase
MLNPAHTAATDDPFVAAWWLRGGHRQTLLGFWFGRNGVDVAGRKHCIPLGDDDRLIVHDSQPDSWQPGDRVAVLCHGLAGSHASGYLRRIACRLLLRGVRVVRVDWRGCGAGVGLSKLPYHSGRSDDLAAVIGWVRRQSPTSPVSVVGFSLSGNIVLKWLGEAPDAIPACVDNAVAVSPPIDLKACVTSLGQGVNRLYDRYFVRLCLEQVAANVAANPAARAWSGPPPRGMYEFDDRFTAPAWGFQSADDYYARCSASRFLGNVAVQTLVITAADDPLVPPEPWQRNPLSDRIHCTVTPSGGHMGFLASGRTAETHWLDDQILNWILKPSSPNRSIRRPP